MGSNLKRWGSVVDNEHMPLQIIDHPLAGHLLASLRDRDTDATTYRLLCRKLTTFLVYEATRSIRTSSGFVETPVTQASAKVLDQDVAVVPILRAGLGMLEAVVDLFPNVTVGFIGLERNEETAEAHGYYKKLPDLTGKFCLCIDPMLATGGSAVQAISIMKASGASQITMVSVIAAPQGVAALQKAHQDVPIFSASLDEGLNEKKYIVPGLGDFGDRLYGT